MKLLFLWHLRVLCNTLTVLYVQCTMFAYTYLKSQQNASIFFEIFKTVMHFKFYISRNLKVQK